MFTTSKRAFVFLSLLLCCASTAHAQFEVKRVKCADLVASGNEFYRAYYSYAGASTIVFQVIKDGCRPTKADGYFRLWRRGSQGSAGIPMIRNGKQTVAMSLTIPQFNYAALEFVSASGGRVSGYVDYRFTIE